MNDALFSYPRGCVSFYTFVRLSENFMEYQSYTLKNGIRLIHKPSGNAVAHFGLMVNAATRDENEEENGLAHFIEHMIFKGTGKRKAFHILSRMENVGGELNAYTTKEETCVYASFLNEFYERAFELLYDISFHSVFPEREIEKEKDVVIDEINSYRDNPSEEIYDEFENMLFNGHPMGKHILGAIPSIRSFKRDMLYGFIRENYNTNQIVLASVGKISFDKLKLLAEKYFGAIPATYRKNKRKPLSAYQPLQKTVHRNSFLSHGCIGNIAYAIKSEQRIPMILLNNILGGPGMNSRLSLSIREKYGFTYNIYSHYMPYTDTGVFSVYLGTDKGYMERSVMLVHKELEKLRTSKMGVLQLKRAKKQIIGQLAISLESNLNEMLSIGRSFMHLNRLKSFEEVAAEIEKVSAEQILNVANEIFDPQQLTTLIFKSNNSHHD